jgi:outer membrane lipoprotein-sorting protein
MGARRLTKPITSLTQDRRRGVKHSGAVIILIALLSTVHFTSIQREAANHGDATQVMRQVVSTYQSLVTYTDKGTSIVHVVSSDYRVEFETLFKRPGKLRFGWNVEYSHKPGHKDHSVVWSDGASAWASYSFHGNKVEPKTDLGLAVAGAIGASWGTASTIARLLTDEVRTVRLDELNRLKMIGNETVDGIDCFVVVGYFATGEECKVWVGRGDYLIRRIQERSETMQREEVRTQIVVNQEIPDSRFSQRGH